MKLVLIISYLSTLIYMTGPTDYSDQPLHSLNLTAKHASLGFYYSTKEPLVKEFLLPNGETLLVRITLPNNYTSNKKFPVVLGPGLDNDNLDAGCRYFGSNPEQYGWILVESLVHLKGPEAMKFLLDYLDKEYPAEGFHLLGFSANSVNQFRLAEVFTDRISSITAMPGHPNFRDKNLARKFGDMKILMLVGERDHWWKKNAMEAEQVLRDRNISVRLLVVPNGGHILDELAGKPLFEELEKLRSKLN